MPPKTRTAKHTKVAVNGDTPGLPVEPSQCLPQRPRRRRVFAEGDQNRMVTRPHGNVTSPAHFPVWFAAAGGEPNGESISECESPSAKKSPLTGSVIHCLRLPLPAHRGQAAYGVRELVTAFWPTAACKHPSSRIPDLPTPICDLRYLVSSCSKSSFYFPLFPLLPPVHSLLRVGVNRNSTQKPAKHIEQEHPRLPAHVSTVAGSLTDPLACASSFCALPRPPTSTQRQQVDPAFRAPRFRSFTDPLACASSFCALPRPPTSTQRQQVDPAFRAPRFRSLTDPLACASSLYALPRPPTSTQRQQVDRASRFAIA